MGPGIMGCDGRCGSTKVVDCAGVRARVASRLRRRTA